MNAYGIVTGIVVGLFFSAFDARANVYATDIKANGGLGAVTNSVTTPVTITYRLNQAATEGVTVGIWQGTTKVATISGGTSMGINTVTWGLTNSSGVALTNGTYSMTVTAAATGFPTWTQISLDSNPGMPAYYPLGIAVDNNTNSPYYGRVVMGCALSGTAATGNVPVAAEQVGLYKMNADGSQADEGWFGDAGYSSDDAGDPQLIGGQMPGTGPYNVDPMKIRIGDDDRIYWVDDSFFGAIIACDMEATTNQIVIDYNNSINNYSQNPDLQILYNGTIGIQQFDVTGTTTTNAALWLCDNDSPDNWGVWMFHLTKGVSDANDQFGTQVVATGGDLSVGSGGGCMVDTNLNIFVGQGVNNETPVYNAMLFSNWNAGALPLPDTNGATAFNFAVGGASGEVAWGFGCGVDTVCTNGASFEGVRDVVINSRTNPTLVACPMSVAANNGTGGGIRVLSAKTGAVISVTNGATVQTLTNIDWLHAYTCAAWDNVGNLYGASTNLNLWRVWSPPGASTNTTAAVPTIVLTTNAVIIGPPPSSTLKITGITRSLTSLTITFSATNSASANSFTLQSSTTLKGSYGAVQGASITGSQGTFTATATMPSGAVTQFYRIFQ